MQIEECWLCEEIENNTYENQSSNGRTRLSFYKERDDSYIIRAWGEDVVEQEITHCPLCGRRLGRRFVIGDKVSLNGEETKITAMAFDEHGIEVYMVEGSMEDYYANELKPI